MDLNPEIESFLKNLALTDWNKFMDVIGIDATQMTICVEKEKGKSWQQIANKVNLPKSTVRNRYKQCRICVKK